VCPSIFTASDRCGRLSHLRLLEERFACENPTTFMDRATAELWMREALVEAAKAEAEEEVPIGAVLLINEKIVGRGHNHSIRSHDPTAHAEILALRYASHGVRNYRLPGSILVVTVEPCVMCVGAMLQARVEQVIYGAADPKTGAVDSHFHLADTAILNHKIEVVSGILEEECGALLKAFFQSRR
jgi:tRNA(adenine34) deaminase